jgi:hypothetical protein
VGLITQAVAERETEQREKGRKGALTSKEGRLANGTSNGERSLGDALARAA